MKFVLRAHNHAQIGIRNVKFMGQGRLIATFIHTPLEMFLRAKERFMQLIIAEQNALFRIS